MAREPRPNVSDWLDTTPKVELQVQLEGTLSTDARSRSRR